MLKVLLTVDTEFWPSDARWPGRPLARPLTGFGEAYRRDVLGRTDSGDFGLPYLLQSLSRHNLRGVFFVEALSSSVIEEPQLQRTVRAIVDAGQEVQLHLHTEWLSEAAVPGLPLKHRQNLGDFSLEEQTAIIRHGLARLRAAGARDVTALRAGNMGGNRDTPAAAHAAGLSLDMSFSPAEGPETRSLIGVLGDGDGGNRACPTVPLTYVEDFPSHYRSAQLTALSFRELRRALLTAADEQWPCFVILLHSFELIHRTNHLFRPLRPNPINIARWNKLCSFLERHRDRFMTVGCLELGGDRASASFSSGSRTRPLETAWRMGEQLVSRFV